MDPKGHEFVMIGYDSESKAYRLWERGTRRVIKSRDVRFIENMDSKNESDAELVEMPLPYAMEGVMADEHLTEVQTKMEPSQQPIDSMSRDLKKPADVEEKDGIWNMASEVTPKKIVELAQRSGRGRGRPKFERTGKKKRPRKIYNKIASLVTDVASSDPSTLEEAMSRGDGELWLEAMKNECDSLIENGTWELVDRPVDRRVISCRWVFKIKRRQSSFTRRDSWHVDASRDMEWIIRKFLLQS